MAGTTSVPAIQFTPAGLVLPAESEILAGVQADQNAAFGGNMNLSLTTPQGQLAMSQTAIIGDKNNQFAYFVSQIDPATSSGAYQDAIGRLYFIDRLPSTSTTVNVVCTGLSGTVIPIGALVQDADGNIYSCTGAGIIPAGGSITLPFAAVQTGPIPCPAGSITTIYQRIIGLDSVANTVDGVIGADVESRADFEYRRKLSVAQNAIGSLNAVYANVINVANVTDAYCTDNRTDATVVIDGQTLLPHSLYAAVVGGTDEEVASAIWLKVDIGCNFNGNTTVEVPDTTNGFTLPVPTYDVTFTRPDPFPIYFAVTVQNLSALPNSTIEASIQSAIIGAFNGSDGGQRARIGSTIFATRYILPISLVGALAILSVFVGSAPNPVTNFQYVGIGNAPTISAGDIAVTFI